MNRKYFIITLGITAGIIILLLHPIGNLMLHLIFMHITSARSNAKIMLFLPWIILSNINCKPKKWEKNVLIAIIILVYTLQIYSLKLLNPELPVQVYRWHVFENAISSNSLLSIHSNKFITGFITENIFPDLEIILDSGWYYTHHLPQWYMVLVTTLIIMSTIFLFRQHQTGWPIKHKMMYTIVSFMIFKNMVDGGPITPEVIIGLPIMIFLLYNISFIQSVVPSIISLIILILTKITPIITLFRSTVLLLIFVLIKKRWPLLIIPILLLSFNTHSQGYFVYEQYDYYNTKINTITNVITTYPCLEDNIFDPLNCTTKIKNEAEWKSLIKQQMLPINYQPIKIKCLESIFHSGILLPNNDINETNAYGKSAQMNIFKVEGNYHYKIKLPKCIPSKISYINLIIEQSINTSFTAVPSK